MIDNFALAISHGLMMLGAILLLRRADLDSEPSPHDRPARTRRRHASNDPEAAGDA